MDQRHVLKSRRDPLGLTRQRVMQLEIPPPMAEHLGRRPVLGQVHILQQPAIKLARRDRGQNRRGCNHFATLQAHPAHPAIAHQNFIHIRVDAHLPALRGDQAFKGPHGRARPALDDRRSCRLNGKGNHLAHLARIGAFRRQPAMQHPRRPKRLHQRGLIGGLKPTARRGQGRSHPRCKSAQTALPYLPEHQLGRRP